ncbi:SDR family oxidoreductase [Nonlabens xiamenensis]|uniref:SDR family oxidoreductase n=1 Tax=Nonlabens xiamenensis TaxID=2341043 RepID=UPI000F615C84|nr:SDR family oxidoreductase [Nonlabens xiamenensis]
MVKDLQNKWGLILGGSHGLGYASALKLARHGMNLIIIYRASKLQQTQIDDSFNHIKDQGVELIAINADATRVEKIQETVKQIKHQLGDDRLDLMLHSIAKGNLKPLAGKDALTTGDFQQTIHSMGISLYTWVQSLLQSECWAAQAQILSFTSEGSTKPMPGYAAVSAAKATLEAITRSLALELAAHGMTANCIQAGVTDTESLKRIPQYELLKSESIKRNPHQQLTTPERVADVVYLLAKSEARWINGTVIQVDGGEHLG